ncbi:LPP20 family lipoprotein [Alkalimarinus coralli]|uniref:LPP20 family lipoprotein n=1 Tax=Alkalimarinus coralli TaxID=2935863 RepID=UPI00202B3BD1|nr:LPP20 family lipoprotein [Alkalimarinus coralli]
MTRKIIVVTISILLSGCSHYWWGGYHDYDDCNTCGANAVPQLAVQPSMTAQTPAPKQESLQPIVIRVTGYGALDTTRKAASERKLLMAMRASKLDAYRALAERVYGTQVFGSSKVQDIVMENDQLRTIVDSNIRGAKVISVNRLKGGGYETIVEMVISPGLRRCLANGPSYNNVCSMLVGSADHSMTEKRPVTDSADHGGGLFYLH